MNQLTETLHSMKTQAVNPNTSFGDYQFSAKKCRRFRCPKPASSKFPCCSITCGVTHKQDVLDYKMYAFSLFSLSNWYGKGIGAWTLEKWMYLSQLITQP